MLTSTRNQRATAQPGDLAAQQAMLQAMAIVFRPEPICGLRYLPKLQPRIIGHPLVPAESFRP